MDIQFGNLSSLYWLGIVAAVVVVLGVAIVARHKALARFATANLLHRFAARSGSKRYFVKSLLVVAAMIALVAALVDVRWGKVWREVPQRGIEVMFVLDVSRSMLAEDATPNRLQRAKQQIEDMTDAMAGDRVGLVVFAGDSRQMVPLTSHHHDFKKTLAEVGPQDVTVGGSRLGDALQMAANGFLDETGNHQAIVVFTDGEDQESEPVKVAQQLHDERDIRIFTVGLGDMDQGARIPDSHSRRSFVEYHGEQVWSKMNGATLKQVALEGGGAYIPAGTKQVAMDQVYHNYVAQVEEQDFETARINSYIPRFQWFVGAGLLLLVIDTLLPATARAPKSSLLGTRLFGKSATAAAVAFCLLATNIAAAAPAESLVQQGNEALHAGDVEKALSSYQQAAVEAPNSPQLLYNQAVAQYRSGQVEAARNLFTQTLATGNKSLDAKARYNLGNCDYAEAVQLAEKDKPAAIAKLNSALDHYRNSLASNANDTDARANAQLAQMLIDQLQQEEEQDQQQQDQQQQDQQQQDQQQQDQQQQDQQQQDQQQQDQQQQDQQQQDQQQQDQQQQDQQQQDQQQQAGGAQENPPQEQPQDQEALPSAAPQFGQQDAQAMEEARPMTKEEAQKMLQAVRDRELMRRLQHQQENQRRYVPVERDW
ncbi:vWA domain-containing protein [Blastopirellula marina]|uniref:Aerotolerance regulator BatB n=1 Tax=Blastopirellula marina TaxID=124 RepID=A0A2S8FP02_9BACT|nr:VWA domain-containing protein [Blastopirellula marina]PQO33604.1 aerotolerance regulator BatB [Blastopirellula marina]PTL43391.1 VWA domain-containing protein [Blastopirellula marina]